MIPQTGMATSAGSYALLNSIPSSDATVITKLRVAGAIFLGKSTMTELGNLKSSVEKMGRSARGGQGQSAYVYGGYAGGGNPLGSSSGSAIAVSAGFAAAALGAETLGSLVAPAGRAALFSLRPTMGLVSRDGTVPGAKSFDMIGPMAKSTCDVALLLQQIAGTDPKDPASECANEDNAKVADKYYSQLPMLICMSRIIPSTLHRHMRHSRENVSASPARLSLTMTFPGCSSSV